MGVVIYATGGAYEYANGSLNAAHLDSVGGCVLVADEDGSTVLAVHTLETVSGAFDSAYVATGEDSPQFEVHFNDGRRVYVREGRLMVQNSSEARIVSSGNSLNIFAIVNLKSAVYVADISSSKVTFKAMDA
jgi:hypothetical protein